VPHRPSRWHLAPRLGLLLAALVTGPAFSGAQPPQPQPPSVFGVDAPELARAGSFAVGVRTLTLVQHDQPDVLAFDAAKGTAPLHDRTLRVVLWYPAKAQAGSTPETYRASLPAESMEPVSFTVPGIAVRDAPAAGGGYPLVIVSHGYSSQPEIMSWLTENLATKGYVVAGIAHDDPPITDRARSVQVILRRAPDIAFVAQTLQQQLGAQHLIDPRRMALVGYSMGGYGALTAAGARLDPASALAKMVPGGLLAHYAGAGRDAVLVRDVRAVVAISPFGGAQAAWGSDGLQAVRSPLLLIAGNKDRTVDYASGARAMFAAATHAERYLLTFREGGHAIGLNPVPQGMQERLWDQDWFEDPVWRKERITAINAHFITAFLDLYVRGDQSRSAYLSVATSDSDAGDWPVAQSLPYDAFSPAAGPVTVWKGFQRSHAAGLELLRAAAER
jgi:predicted dienelactone hydrolase